MNSFCQAFNFKSFAPIIIAVHNWYVYILSYGLKLIIYNIETLYCFLNVTQYQTVWQNWLNFMDINTVLMSFINY